MYTERKSTRVTIFLDEIRRVKKMRRGGVKGVIVSESTTGSDVDRSALSLGISKAAAQCL